MRYIARSPHPAYYRPWAGRPRYLMDLWNTAGIRDRGGARVQAVRRRELRIQVA